MGLAHKFKTSDKKSTEAQQPSDLISKPQFSLSPTAFSVPSHNYPLTSTSLDTPVVPTKDSANPDTNKISPPVSPNKIVEAHPSLSPFPPQNISSLSFSDKTSVPLNLPDSEIFYSSIITEEIPPIINTTSTPLSSYQSQMCDAAFT